MQNLEGFGYIFMV